PAGLPSILLKLTNKLNGPVPASLTPTPSSVLLAITLYLMVLPTGPSFAEPTPLAVKSLYSITIPLDGLRNTPRNQLLISLFAIKALVVVFVALITPLPVEVLGPLISLYSTCALSTPVLMYTPKVSLKAVESLMIKPCKVTP